MLKRLHIRNYALIDDLTIDFSERLTIITGETGAGKSILLGALGLVMGERADSKVFYNDGEKCVVEAVFDVEKYDIKGFFEENEFDYDHEVVIRRELSPTGKSRAFVNDTPANNVALQRLTEALVDIHQQFDTLDIHHVNFQLRMIDALADNTALLQEYQNGYRRYSSDKKRLAELVDMSERGEKESAFLQFQLEELQKAELKEGEQEILESELARLTNAEDIKRGYGAAFNALSETEHSILGQLQELARSIHPTRKLDRELDELGERLSGAIQELQSVAKDCDRISEKTEYDPERIAEIQQRLDLLFKLQKKHGVSEMSALIELRDRLADQTSDFTHLKETIGELEKSIAAQETALRTLAENLSTRRKSVRDGFVDRVHELLSQLSMQHARLRVDIEETPRLTPTGIDEVQFLFAGNVGSKFQPIREVASGGELSRLTLCTKSLVADAIPLPTLIFDEIDAGVSGDVSLKMGLILKDLSKRHQVVTITHTPQIAARGDRHYFVYKKVEDNKTATRIRALDPEERVRSIAAMLSGNPPSEAALATARELTGLTS